MTTEIPSIFHIFSLSAFSSWEPLLSEWNSRYFDFCEMVRSCRTMKKPPGDNELSSDDFIISDFIVKIKNFSKQNVIRA